MADPVPSVAVATGSLVVTGTATNFIAAENDLFVAGGAVVPIASRDSPTQITLKQPWPVASLSGSPAFNLLSLGEYWRNAISINKRFADLLAKWEVVSPFKFDAAGTLAERDGYNNQPRGFVYIATDQLPVRLYIKLANTNASSDWSAGIYIGSGGQVEFQEALDQERQQRTQADAALSTRIDQVAGSVDLQLRPDLNTEITRSTGRDSQHDTLIGGLRTDLTAEASTRGAKDAALDGRIDAEASARASADNTLGGRVDAETAARLAADTTLSTQIDAEASKRIAADTSLGGRIDTEISARTAADIALGVRVDNEAAARSSADTVLVNRIAAEEGRAQGRENYVEALVAQEQQNRINADAQETTRALAAEAQARDLTAAEATRAKAAEAALTDLARQSAPKYVTTPSAYIEAKGGAVQTSPLSVKVPAGQNGAGTLIRAYIAMDTGDIARNAGRDLFLLAEIKGPIGLDTKFVGPGGLTDVRLSATPIGVPGGSTAFLRVTNGLDTYVLGLLTKLTGTETQPAIDLYIAAGAVPLLADVEIRVNKALWVPLDTAGSSDVVAAGDAATLVSAKAYSDVEKSRAQTAEGVVTDLSRQAAPKNVVPPRAFTAPASGAVKIGNTGWRVPIGQTGAGSLLRVYWDLTSGDVARNAGRPLQLIAELKTTLGFGTAFVGPLGPGDVRLGISPEAMPAGTTIVLRVTPRADTYLLIMETMLTGTETQIAANILIASGALAQTSEASVNLNKTLWVALDATGTSEVVTAGDAVSLAAAKAYTDVLATTVATLPLAPPDMVALSTTRYQPLAGGAYVDVCPRLVRIPAGQSGAGMVQVNGMPFAGLVAGTLARFRFRLQVSADIGTSAEALATQVSIYGCTINRIDGSQIGQGGATITRVVPGVIDLTVTRLVDGTEREIEIYLKIADASPVRASPGFIVLRNAWIEALSTSGNLTVSGQMQRCAEAKIAMLADKPGFKDWLVVAKDGTGDFTTIFDANEAIAPGASESEYSQIYLLPGKYTGECSPTKTIRLKKNVKLLGVGRPEEILISAIFPPDQQQQSEIQPFFLEQSCWIEGCSAELENGRYPAHVESGNSQARAVHVFKNLRVRHRGATGWASHSPFGIGLHAGNRLYFERVHTLSDTAGISFHDNINWDREGYVEIVDCDLHATGIDGQSVSAVAMGSGQMSKVRVRNTKLEGTVVQITTYTIPGVNLALYKVYRYGFDMVFTNCSPFDWFSDCDVSCLALSSVAGPNSSVALSGPLFDALFSTNPDYRLGAADRAALVYGRDGVDVPAGETDPGVGMGPRRLKDLRAAPLSGTIVFDGTITVTITGDKDYTQYSNSGVISDFNAKLSAAMGPTGGRMFSLAKPWKNRAPIFQPDREANGINLGTASITKGHQLVWSGKGMRLMTSSDGPEIWAGVALNDPVPGQEARAQKSGHISQPHLLFDGTPTFAVGDLFGVGPNPGLLIKNAAHPMLRVRALKSYGAVFEILGARVGPNATEIIDASVTGRSVLTGTAAQGATALGLGTGDSANFASLAIGGVATLNNNSGFTIIKDGSGTVNSLVFGSNDPTNYHKNTNHYFQSRDGATSFAYINPTGIVSNVPVRLASYTVATLPSPGTAGRTAWASNGRAFSGGTLQGAGAGTGVLASDDGAAWRVAGTTQTVQA